MPNSRLLVHCIMPDGAAAALQTEYLDAAVSAERRVYLTDPMHEARWRYPSALGPLPEATRLVGGCVPFGYLDALPGRAVYAMVLGDPEAAFLRLAARVSGMEPERRAALGLGGLPAEDPQALVPALLGHGRVRRRHVNAMTRLCAGAPRIAPQGGSDDPEGLLRAARANLARTNCLAGIGDDAAPFASYLSAVFGWPSPAVDAPLTVAPPAPAPETLPPSVRDALRAAMDLDLRLYESARASFDEVVA